MLQCNKLIVAETMLGALMSRNVYCLNVFVLCENDINN